MCVHNMCRTLISDENDAFLVPVPQYPLYSAALALYGGTLLPYYLNEDDHWSINVAEVAATIAKAKSEGKRVQGMVVINPGNPTGQALDVKNQVRTAVSDAVPMDHQ